MNDLGSYANAFRDITPWTGNVPKGFLVDFLGTLTDGRFRAPFGVDPASVGGGVIATQLPVIEHGEGWFEAVNWVEAARAAKDRFVMITLGACYGSQAIGSYKALQALNPMPCKLVAVEPEPDNYLWLAKHFRDNNVDPDDHWLLQMAIGDKNDPVLFPVGAPGSGAQNCYSTNEVGARTYYASEIIASGRLEEALKNLLLHNTTGLTKDLVPGYNFNAEIKYVSAMTLRDLIGPFDFIDYIESDIQQSEILVFPPCIELLGKKVRRIHIGTHGIDVHNALHDLFKQNGWEIVFNFEPNATFDTVLGRFDTNDGVLTVRNPRL